VKQGEGGVCERWVKRRKKAWVGGGGGADRESIALRI